MGHALPGEEEEIAGDPFFQRYNFPSGEASKEEASSSGDGLDSSSDTEGPLSPTHIKGRQSAFADALPSPRSPVPSVAVSRCLLRLPARSLQHADVGAPVWSQ
jgi:hypothetical protein